MWPKISQNYSPNFHVIKRFKKNIKFIIIHYTGMKKELAAISRLCDVKSKVSAHYFIKKNGSILNLVPPLYEAWHAGRSNWKNYKSLNRYSIGIEIQNSGHDNKYENFSQKQITSTKKLDLYVCLRPMRWFKGVLTPTKKPEDVDMVLFRENTEELDSSS